MRANQFIIIHIILVLIMLWYASASFPNFDDDGGNDNIDLDNHPKQDENYMDHDDSGSSTGQMSGQPNDGPVNPNGAGPMTLGGGVTIGLYESSTINPYVGFSFNPYEFSTTDPDGDTPGEHATDDHSPVSDTTPDPFDGIYGRETTRKTMPADRKTRKIKTFTSATKTIFFPNKPSKAITKPTKATKTTTTPITTPRMTTDAPTSPRMTTDEPTTPRRTTEEPTTPRTTTEEPTTPRMTTEEPTSPRMTTEEPTTPRMTTDAPTSPRMTTDAPTSPRMTTDAPTSPRRTTEEPTTPRTTTEEPTTPRMTTEEPISPRMTTEEPFTPTNGEDTIPTTMDTSIIVIPSSGTSTTISSPTTHKTLNFTTSKFSNLTTRATKRTPKLRTVTTLATTIPPPPPPVIVTRVPGKITTTAILITPEAMKLQSVETVCRQDSQKTKCSELCGILRKGAREDKGMGFLALLLIIMDIIMVFPLILVLVLLIMLCKKKKVKEDKPTPPRVVSKIIAPPLKKVASAEQVADKRVFEDDENKDDSVTAVSSAEPEANPFARLQPKKRVYSKSTKQRYFAAIAKQKAQEDEDKKESNYIKMGKVFFPLEVDDSAFKQQGDFPKEPVVLDKLTYNPAKNERFFIGSEIDDVEYAPSEVSSDSDDESVKEGLNLNLRKPAPVAQGAAAPAVAPPVVIPSSTPRNPNVGGAPKTPNESLKKAKSFSSEKKTKNP